MTDTTTTAATATTATSTSTASNNDENNENVNACGEEEAENKVFEINYKQSELAHFNGLSQRVTAYQDSLLNSDRFWGNFAKKNVDWFAPFDTIQTGTFQKGDIAWFLNGKLNVCYNCVDRWVKYKPDAVALIWEGNEIEDTKYITFKEVQEEVCRLANVLKRYGVRKGDIVVIYMPMIPEAAYAMLACARIGAPHSVIFAGFSAPAITDRVRDANAKFVICANEGFRGKKIVPLKKTVDAGLAACADIVDKCFVFMRTANPCAMVAGRDLDLGAEMQKERPFCPCEVMDSEDTLFLLYTSGSTGKPKGVLHTNGGYLVYTMATHRYVFDIQAGDVYACVADIGWITGHSYIVYAPLANGSTTFMFESLPTYPDAGRYWSMVERHKITQFYTAPTAVRALQKHGNAFVEKYDLSSLRVLGSVGEPINPEAWLWYYEVVGQKRCPIVDTYWQTETGGIVITPLPSATKLKPGSATMPFFGIECALINKQTLEEIPDSSPYMQKILGNNNNNSNNSNTNANANSNNAGQKTTETGEEKEAEAAVANVNESGDATGILVMKRPWPGMARTVYGDHQRYLNTYMNVYPGFYYTGDGANRDEDGFYWITGRVDDVINTSGHRVGTAEIEAVVVQQKGVVESAVVAIPHDTKGHAIFVYAIADASVDLDDAAQCLALRKAIRLLIRSVLSPIFTPDNIMLVPGVPKTRSGKIMRRILRKVASQEYSNLGDVTTLADPSIVDKLIALRKDL